MSVFAILASVISKNNEVGNSAISNKTTTGTTDTLLANQYFNTAGVFKDSSNYDSAAVYYLKAGQIYEKELVWERFVEAYNHLGFCHKAMAEYKKAMTYLEIALEKGELSLENNHPGLAKSYNTIGSIYYFQRLYKKAMHCFQKALKIRETVFSTDHPELANSYSNIGLVYLREGKYEKAIEYLERALKIRRAALKENHPAIADSYLNIGNIYYDKAQYNKALEYFLKALEIWKIVHGVNSEKVAFAYNNIGLVHYAQGGYRGALENLFEALEIKKIIYGQFHLEVALAYNNIGTIYSEQGAYDISMDYLEKALDIRKEALEPNHPELADSYHNIGMIYHLQGIYSQAISYYQNSLKVYESIYGTTHTEVADSYNNIGLAYYEQGLNVQALEYFHKALKIWKDIYNNSHEDIAMVYNNIGLVYSDRGLHNQAIEFHKRSIAILEKIHGKNHPDVAMAFNNIGTSYISLRSNDQALENLQKSLEIWKMVHGKNHPDIALAYYNIGRVYIDLLYEKQDSFDQALIFLQKALHRLSKQFKDPHIYHNPPSLISDSKLRLLGVLNAKAFVFLEKFKKQSKNEKDLHASMATYELAAVLIDTIRNVLIEKEDKESLAEKALITYEGGIKSAIALYKETNEPKYMANAFYFMEKNKSRQLLESLNESSARHFAGIPDSLITKETALKTRIALDEKAILEAKEKGDSARVVQRQGTLFDKKQAYRELIGTFENNYPQYHHLKYDHKTVDANAFQKEVLGTEDALLEYFTGDSSIYAFAVAKEDMVAWEIKKDSLFDSAFRNIRACLTNPGTSIDTFINTAAFLYDKLISPAEALIRRKHLIIVPDGQLAYLPFDILLPRKPAKKQLYWGTLDYLFKSTSISYSYSATLHHETAQKEKKANKLNYIAFAPDFNSRPESVKDSFSFDQAIAVRGNLQELPGAKREVETLAQHAEGQAFFGANASEDVFKEQAPSYGIIHISTHAIIDDRHPMNSQLLFSQSPEFKEDGNLYAYELYNMNLQAEMVVLSACNTGFGKLQRGEGVASLGRAFAYAGCPSMVMSLWPAPDERTADIMEYFYQALDVGKNKGEALQTARTQYLATVDDVSSHPFYWAGFVSVGDQRPLNFQSGKNPAFYVFTAFFLLATLLYFRKLDFRR